MSKSVYEVALEAFKQYQRFNDPNDYNKYELDVNVIPTINNTLEQAQKQEGLLNKIKEIIDRPYNPNIMPMFEKLERYNEIVKLIKELENDK